MNIISHFRRTWRTYALGLLGVIAAVVVLTSPEPAPAAAQFAAGAASVLLVVAATRAATTWISRPAPAVQLRSVQPGGEPPVGISAHTRDDGLVETRIGEVTHLMTGDQADELVAQIVAARTDQERASLGFGRGRHTACPLCACLVTDGGHDQHDRWHLYLEQLGERP